MKLLIAFSISAVLLAAADQAPKPLTIPHGAVATALSTYRYTDAKGQTWIYYTSPFGVMREQEGAPQRRTSDYSNVKATEQGDSIRFENPTPFGPYRWQTKKSELNEMERTVWQREQAAHAPAAAQE